MSVSLKFEHLPEIAQTAIKQALERGATDAECTISEGQEFSASVRMGEVETLKEAGSRGRRSARADRQADGIVVHVGPDARRHRSNGVAPPSIWPQLTTEDPQAGLPDAAELGSLTGDLKLFSDEVAGLAADRKIDAAKRAEAAALDVRSAHHQFGRRIFRFEHRRTRVCQFARFRRSLSIHLLLNFRRSRGHSRMEAWNAIIGSPSPGISRVWNPRNQSGAQRRSASFGGWER